MKKIALTSLLAVFAISGAHAANVIDGNPLYMPAQNHFYSVTDLYSHTGEHANGDKQIKDWTLSEEFGYGVMDNLAINLRTALHEEQGFDDYSMGDLGFKVTYRALDMGAWKADLFGEFAIDGGSIFDHVKKNDEGKKETYWFDEEHNMYNWTAGIRGGYTTSLFTVAGRVEFTYTNTESFNWGDEGMHTWTFGLDGQYVINDDWNLVGTVEYKGVSSDKTEIYGVEYDIKNAGRWFGEFGVNYNIDATKYVGLYINGTMNHWKGDDLEEAHKKGWGFEEGFGFGAKFGIDF